MAIFYAPMVSALAAIVAGIGVNIVTDQSSPLLQSASGTVYIAAGMLLIAWSGSKLVKTVGGSSDGLSCARHRMRAVLAITSATPLTHDQHAHALRQARLLAQTGQRLLDRAEGFTLLDWVRRRRRRQLAVMGLWALNAAYLVFIVGLMMFRAVAPALPALGLAALSTLLAVAAVMLDWTTCRRDWIAVGTELRDNGTTAHARLLRYALPPAPTPLRWGQRARRWWTR
ncbi:hypothetical protein [Actinomadura hibisca]|uniref:hypothetical protein n=1 Tax=Actinomadura hibisca TaxID=68565 RepID=UPI0012FC1F57|nr:hypothetical protein [Actinomadura hibisca]